MSDNPVASRAQRHLMTFAEGFRINPLPNIEIPEPAERAGFLREHPQYYEPYYRITALTFAGDRKILEEMTPDYQQLGGTLIRVAFTDEEIKQISDKPAYTLI